jgi:hypothetical protein
MSVDADGADLVFRARVKHISPVEPRNALYQIGENERHEAEQDHTGERRRGCLAVPTFPLDDRVRVA